MNSTILSKKMITAFLTFLLTATCFLYAQGQVLNVASYGAVGDGVTDDTNAIQTALNAMSTTPALEFSAGKTYLISSSLQLTKSTNHKIYVINGNGCSIITNTDNVSIFQRIPADMTEAGQIVSLAFHIKDITFQGNSSGTGQKGIELGATYGTVVDGCHFSSLNTGVDFMFCLMGKIRDCLATLCRDDAFVIRTGKNVFSTHNYCASNHTTIESTRVYNHTDAFSSFKVIACSGVSILNCIAEGSDPDYNIYYDYDGVTTSKSFFINNVHIENSADQALIKVIPGGGILEVKGVFTQITNNKVLDISSGLQTQIKIQDFPWLPSGCTFDAGNQSNTWTFINCGPDFSDANKWSNTVLPKYMVQHGRNYIGSPTVAVHAVGNYTIGGTGLVRLEPRFGVLANMLSIGDDSSQQTLFLNMTKEAWNPGTVPAGGIVTQTFTVPEATTSQKFQITANLTTIGSKDIMISASVSAANTVKVILFNPTSSDIVVDSGYVLITVRLWK